MPNGQGQAGQPPVGPNDGGMGKNVFGGPGQAGRQYYPHQSQQGYGSVQGLNYPYAGAGVGSYQYGVGQCRRIRSSRSRSHIWSYST